MRAVVFFDATFAAILLASLVIYATGKCVFNPARSPWPAVFERPHPYFLNGPHPRWSKCGATGPSPKGADDRDITGEEVGSGGKVRGHEG
jgi:hypothetical protein